MASLFVSVRLPKQPHTRLTLDNIDLSGKNIADLKNDMEQLLKYPQNELELIYCGMVLHNENQTLQDYGIRPLTTIQVYQRRHEVKFDSNEPTEEQIDKAVSCYRTILKEMTNGTITKSVRPEIIRKVVEAYPEYYSNLGAYAILRDFILVQSMAMFDSASALAHEYPILVHSAEFLTKVMYEHSSVFKPIPFQNFEPQEDSLSDTSSSEGDAPMTISNRRANNIRQISRDQLSHALAQAGSASLNSLLNIAQRDPQQQTPTTAPTSSASTAASAVPSSSTAAQMPGNIISNSIFSNALSQALASSSNTPVSADAPMTTPIPANQSSEPNENLSERYASELQTMREMGLQDDITNLRALDMSNGEVEAAINLVLMGLGMFN